MNAETTGFKNKRIKDKSMCLSAKSQLNLCKSAF